MAGLVERLRSLKDFTCDEAADRIEELENDLSASQMDLDTRQQPKVDEMQSRIAALEAEKTDLLDTIQAMLHAAGWDGTLESLNATGSKPSHFIRAALQSAGEGEG